MHHLLIMEELGGDERFFDRFLAQHIAFGYYALVIVLYLINPVEAYNLNQDVEEHAFATYDEYLKENEEKLKSMPAPQAAIDYYVDGDMYMFGKFFDLWIDCCCSHSTPYFSHRCPLKQ
ncbi:hypothetical protein ACHAXR_000090 [Thalassiosira sp. AJA248-18]